MRIQRSRPIAILALLITVTITALPDGCDPLLASEDNSLIPDQEQKYISVLKSEAPIPEKARACEELSRIGTAKSVPALAALLGDEILGDYARFALEQIRDPAVDQVFRQAMGTLQGRLLAGVVNSIGVRRDTEAVDGLSKLAGNPASGVAAEAIAALGRIATDQAVDTLVHILSTGRPEFRIAAADACLVSAEFRLAGNNRKEALKLYDAVRKAEIPPHLSAAATYGAILNRGTDGIPLLIEQLQTDDPVKLDIALRAARRLPGSEVTETLTAELNKSRPAIRILLIKALVDRKDPGAYESIKALVADENPQVRLESLKTLGRIGDAGDIPVLLKAAATDGDEAAIALTNLREIKGDGVDEAITAGMKTAAEKLRPELIKVLTDRGCHSALPTFFEQAGSENPAIAKAALRGIGTLSDYQDLPAVIDLLVEISDSDLRDEALSAVIATIRRSADGHESAINSLILQRLEKAGSVPVRCTLMKSLSAVPSEASLKWLQDALKDANAQVRDAAVRTIADYPEPAAAEVLLNIFKTSQDKVHRILALDGCIRLCKTTDIPATTAIKFYRQAIEQADSAAELKLILSGLAKAAHPEALELTLKAIDQPSVKAEASIAAIALAQEISATYPSLASRAARKILSDPSLKDLHVQARTLIETTGEFVSIFDGRSFAGWEGDTAKTWRIENGTITAGSLQEQAPRNEFLATTGEYENFDLELKFKITGNRSVNAGVQFRSKRIPNHYEVSGYQADIGQGVDGHLYDESRRRTMLVTPDKETLEKVQAAVGYDGWQTYRIRAEANRIKLWLNGVNTVDYVEKDTTIPRTGIIALQIHGGMQAVISYKDIELRELPAK